MVTDTFAVIKLFILTSTQFFEHQIKAGTIFEELDQFQNIPEPRYFQQIKVLSFCVVIFLLKTPWS